jgi:hypothetical protein
MVHAHVPVLGWRWPQEGSCRKGLDHVAILPLQPPSSSAQLAEGKLLSVAMRSWFITLRLLFVLAYCRNFRRARPSALSTVFCGTSRGGDLLVGQTLQNTASTGVRAD